MVDGEEILSRLQFYFHATFPLEFIFMQGIADNLTASAH